jgi:cyclopropane fatty-acyl-phospholipid synthase-like methyltransferase
VLLSNAFCSYWDCPDAHLPVLQDAPYQAAWERALAAAAPLLQDAVVLDIGCAMGTLAMAAAKVRLQWQLQKQAFLMPD